MAAVSDLILLHGNGVKDPNFIAEMVSGTRALSSYRPMPIVFNEDDHFDFDQPSEQHVWSPSPIAPPGAISILAKARAARALVRTTRKAINSCR